MIYLPHGEAVGVAVFIYLFIYLLYMIDVPHLGNHDEAVGVVVFDPL
jgi:hypothetical protein